MNTAPNAVSCTGIIFLHVPLYASRQDQESMYAMHHFASRDWLQSVVHAVPPAQKLKISELVFGRLSEK